jgi:hypothetical protein
MPDGITPFDSNEGVMVGTKLPIVVLSDSNDFWSGGLFIEDQNRAYGLLEGRGCDPNRLLYDPNRSGSVPKLVQYFEDFRDSHSAIAGESARVTAWEDSSIQGFDLYTTEINDSNFIAGEWFLIDYEAKETGDCNIAFYDYSISWTIPQQYIKLTNVPTRNLNYDPNQHVDFIDYTIFSSKWGDISCVEPNWCQGADLDRDGYVDYNDLGLFVDYWLWNTVPDYNSKAKESSGEETYPVDPNIIFRIVDINGVNDITLDVNQSIRLYVGLVTYGYQDVQSFNVEVNISNTNSGSIDNTEHPSGTAEILAVPYRDTKWDYWAPGVEQQEGIILMGITKGGAIADGSLASFVYTPLAEGDIELSLINRGSLDTDNEYIFPKLEKIIIHQVDPSSQQMMGGGMESMSMTEGTEEELPPEPYTEEEFVNDLEVFWKDNEAFKDEVSKKELNQFIDEILSD